MPNEGRLTGSTGPGYCQPLLNKETGNESEASQANCCSGACRGDALRMAALKKLAAGAKITEFAEEIEHGQTFYEGSWKSAAGVGTDVLVTKTGDLVEVEEKIPLDKVPAAVVKAARRAAGKSAQLSCEKKTMILYEIKFTKAGSRHELLLSPDGRRVEEEIEKREPRKVGRARGKDEDDEDDQGK